MTSRERMLTSLSGNQPDFIPCSFMLFFNLHKKCTDNTNYIARTLEMGLDATPHVGYLPHTLHPETTYKEWIEKEGSETYFCRKIETPEGPLTARVKQWKNWPQEGAFPIMDDWIVPRSEEILVKPETDLAKLS